MRIFSCPDVHHVFHASFRKQLTETTEASEKDAYIN